MKIRQGFISNSSTSSFVVFGVKLTEEEIQNFIINNFHVPKKKIINAKIKGEKYNEFSYEDFNENCKSLTNLSIINPIDKEAPGVNRCGIYFGKNMGNLETISYISLDDLKNVQEKLLKYFPDKKASFYGRIIYV